MHNCWQSKCCTCFVTLRPTKTLSSTRNYWAGNSQACEWRNYIMYFYSFYNTVTKKYLQTRPDTPTVMSSVPAATHMMGMENEAGLAAACWKCNSLGPRKTQMQFLAFFRKCRANIMICIDTRLSKTSEEHFKKLWGGTAFFNSLCSNSRSIAVLIKDVVDISEAKFMSIIHSGPWPGHSWFFIFLVRPSAFVHG